MSTNAPNHQIRAAHTEHTVTVYQAFDPAIAGPAVAGQRLGAGFKRQRMTWIKPSFLWMMYRSAWATAPGQERVLAVELTREGFEAALGLATASSYTPALHATREQWRQDLHHSPVRFQWDPERDLRLRPLPWRSLQLGLSGPAVDQYLDSWTVSLTDVTEQAHRIRDLARRGDPDAAGLLPAERSYPLPSTLAARLGATAEG
ncbi:DUF4291 domain-containing protein [Streptacidiphilus sp. P02-A3a]|uniref:DUF4291 domain-containing protein n=1 Tax=Streptacidiphilus sp. P02-A3a TaxID=2704468 RepID=UPI0015F9B13E|nr:DUF4291 domain-containing protein [Streptacidiphilus sp. P02-A3a]QMU71113.1 DUF4291 domain-containing protein [Streptacidiphilus sp. P02-A3a]